MRAGEIDQFSEILGGVLGFYGRDVSQFTLEIWWRAMQPFDLAAVSEALSRHCVDADKGAFPPKPSDVVRLLQGGSKDGAALAWAKVDKAIRCVGTYQSVVFDDPLIHACITDMGGWTALGRVDNDEWPFLAKRFETLYQGYRLRVDVPPYPPIMIGVAEADNSQRGLESDPPKLIGDPEKAAAVWRRGSENGVLKITSIGKHLADKIRLIQSESNQEAA